MANEILTKIGAAVALTCTELNDLATNRGMQCTRVTDTSPSVARVRIHYSITTTSTPTAGGLIEFYLSRSDGGSLADGSTGTTDEVWPDPAAAVTTYDKAQLVFLHAQPVSATAGAWVGSFDVDEPSSDWRLVIVNETAQPLHASAHSLTYRTMTPEVQ